MTRLLYVANARIPTEKAHGLQIMQNCEAFAAQGATVALWTPRRFNTRALRSVDVYAHYGVAPIFRHRRLPCIDLIPLVPEQNNRRAHVIFLLQSLTFTLAVLIGALFTRADVYYSRDLLPLLALSLIKPRRALAYEPHRASKRGRWVQRLVIRRVGHVFPVTPPLRDELVRLSGAPVDKFHVAHDGFRRARFDNVPDQPAARAALGWPKDAFIVGYVGRLQTLSMDKGVGLLVSALRQVDGAALGLVGGPDDMAATIRQQWCDDGLPDTAFLYAGQVPPDRVPLYLSAFDVCAMPFPWTEHFAYYASPIKLFEYMASGRALVASDLPAYADVITDGVHGLLVPPSDVAALAAALTRLRDDPALCQRIGAAAQQRALDGYTWEARAAAILKHMER